MTSSAAPTGAQRAEPGVGNPAVAQARPRPIASGDLAWIASVPVAAVVVLAIVVAGAALGHALLEPPPIGYGPSWESAFRPEPAEQGRFLVALTAPLLLLALTAVAVRHPPALAPAATGLVVTGAQAVWTLFAVVCVVAQWRFSFGPLYSLSEDSFRRVYFTLPTLVVAAAITAAFLLATHAPRVRECAAGWLRDTTARRVVAGALALLAVALWLSHMIYREATIGSGNLSVSYHLQFPLDETFAVVNGRTPLVDFVSQYGFLWPYPFALGIELLGDSVGAWTTMAALVTGAGMIAMFLVLRRVVRSSVAALVLFLPFLAASFFMLHGPLDDRYTFGNYFGSFPIRFAGPFFLAWLTARHLDGARPRSAGPLFLLAGLVAINNIDHGIPALGATIAALAWAQGRPTKAWLARLALAVALGLVAAFALVSLLTLARTGSLPRPELMTRFSRLFGTSGFGMLPMPTLGLHVVVYLTFVATITVGGVRSIANAPDRLLTGMLAWSGVFGLGASAYYVGRSHPESLIATFPMWSFCLALLTPVAIRSLGVRRRRRLPMAELACVFWFAVLGCTLAQTPTPWNQIARIVRAAPAPGPLLGERFVAERVRAGEPVVILMLMGHRIADRIGVDDVAPYFGSSSMPLDVQLDETIEALREAGGSKVFLWRGDTRVDQIQGLALHGFVLEARRRARGADLELWVDRSLP